MIPVRIYIFLSLMVCATACSSGQNIARTKSGETRTLCSFRSTPPGATIIVDSVTVGTTPLDSVDMTPGRHHLRYLHPSGSSWFYEAQEETLTIVEGEYVGKDVRFPSLWRITSEPFGARVIIGDSMAGQTPLYLRSTSAIQLVRLSKEGYEDQLVPVSAENRDIHAILNPTAGTGGTPGSRYLADVDRKVATPLYISAGATVVTGVAAAFLKIRADSYYNDYKSSGDSGTLDHVRSLDRYSAIALVISQVSLGILTYQLLTR